MRSLITLCLLAFLSFFLTLSALPLWAVSSGSSQSAAGLVTTVMLAGTVGTQTLVPALTRAFGPARVLAGGLIALGGPAPFYLLHHELWWMLLVSAVRGLGFGIVTVLIPILTTHIAPAGRHGEAIGLYGLAIALPNLLAVPGGVALTAAGRFDVVAILAASPLLALPLVRSIAGSSPAGRPTAGSGPSTTRTLKSLSAVSIVLLFVTLAGAGVLTFVPIARPHGFTATATLLLLGSTAALARWRVGLMSDRMSIRMLLSVGLGLTAVGMVMTAVGLAAGEGPAGTAIILVGAAVLGIGYGAVQNLTLLVSFAVAGPDQQTLASAVWNAAFDTGTALGALLVGVVAGGIGLPTTFGICAVAIALTYPLARSATRKGIS